MEKDKGITLEQAITRTLQSFSTSARVLEEMEP